MLKSVDSRLSLINLAKLSKVDHCKSVADQVPLGCIAE